MVAATRPSTQPDSPNAAYASAKPIPMVPGGLPVVGHLPEMQRDFLGLIDRARDTVGDIAAIQAGPKRVVVISDPAVTEYVLVENPRNYSKQTRGYDQLRKMLGNGLVTSEGSFWLRQRRIAQPAFHREKLAHLGAIMQRDTDEMLEAWSARLLATGAQFDFSDEMMKLTMRIIGEALFSVDVSGHGDAAGAAFTEVVHQATARTVSLFNFPDFVPTPANRRFLNARKVLDELVYGIIRERRAGEAKPDLLSMLLEAKDEETGETMTDQQLRDEAITLFGAGHETTSTALTWTLHELMNHPEVEAKLRAEIDAASPDGAAVPMERLMRMPYLDAVLKESLRLHPPIWLVARQCESDDVIAGYQIPKGDLVFVAQWLVHRHPRLWRDALTFDPERFASLAKDDVPGGHKYAYFPFLGGPRKCIGDQLALLEARIILVRLLQRARFERVPGHAVVEDPAVSLRIHGGLPVTARPAR